MKKIFTSDRSTYFLLVIVLFLAATLGGNILAVQEMREKLSQNLRDDFQRQEVLTAETLSRTLKNEIIGIQKKLQLIAENDEIRNHSKGNCNQKLSELNEIVKHKIGNLGRVAKNGNFVCSLNKALIGVKAETLGSYIKDIFDDPEHQPVLSRAIKPPGADGYVAALHIPVFSSAGAFDGTLGGAIYFNQLNEKYFQDVKIAKDAYIVLLDDNGDILHHFYRELIGKKYTSKEFSRYALPEVYQEIIATAQSNKTGTKVYTFNKQKKIGSFTTVDIMPVRQWIVLVTLPYEEIDNNLKKLELNKLFHRFVILNSLLLIAASIIFSYIFLKNYNRLNELARKLQQLDKLKDEFLSIASHELRTPMTAIKGYVSMIQDGDFGKVNDNLKEPLADIRASTQRLINLVNDMLDVSRIEAGRIRLSLAELKVKPLIEEVVNGLQPIALSKKLKLSISQLTESAVTADQDKFKQILNNLIGNALKFTDSGEIKVSAVDTVSSVKIIVEDSGAGISPENQKSLFSKFQQITTVQKGKPEGTGLGLYISRELVRKMQGDLWIEKSEPGKGSVFAFSLPRPNVNKTAK